MTPRLAWPSSIALRLSAGSSGLNSIPPSAFSATATIAASAVNSLAVARVHLHLSVAARHRRDRRGQPALELGGLCDRGQQGAGAARDGDATSGELGELEAVARQGVPAQDRHSSRLRQRPVCDRLELGLQHVALLLVEVELLDPLGDREPVEARELVQRGQRGVRLRQRLANAVDEAVPPAARDRVPFLDGSRPALVADVPVGASGVVAELDREPRPGQLGEGVRLVPVHPGAAVLDGEPLPLGAPGATSEPVASLQQQGPAAPLRALAGGGDAREATPDNDHVIALGHPEVYKCTSRMYQTVGMSVPTNGKRLNPRRGKILEATLRVIGESGVNGVTHRAVAQEADVALASTTYYFDSKDALVEEALEQMIFRSIEDVRRFTACSDQIEQAELIDRIVGFADAQINDPLAFLTAQYELMLEAGRREHLHPLVRRWTVAYMDGFNHLVQSAGLPEPVAAAEMITNFVEGALLNHVATPSDDFLESRFRPLLTDLVGALDSGLPRTRLREG